MPGTHVISGLRVDFHRRPKSGAFWNLMGTRRGWLKPLVSKIEDQALRPPTIFNQLKLVGPKQTQLVSRSGITTLLSTEH